MAKSKLSLIIPAFALALSLAAPNAVAQELSPAVLAGSPSCAELKAEITSAKQKIRSGKQQLAKVQTSIDALVELIADVLGPKAADVSTTIQFALVDRSSAKEVKEQLYFELEESEQAIEEVAGLYGEALELKGQRSPLNRAIGKARRDLKKLESLSSHCQNSI